MRVSYSLLWSLKDLGTQDDRMHVAMVLGQWIEAEQRREKVECTYNSQTDLLSIRIGQGPTRHHTLSGMSRNPAVVGAVGSVPPPRTTTLTDMPVIQRADAITVKDVGPIVKHTTLTGMPTLPPPPPEMVRRLSSAITQPGFHIPAFMISPGYHSQVGGTEEIVIISDNDGAPDDEE